MFSAKRITSLFMACFGLILLILGILTQKSTINYNTELALLYFVVGLPLFAFGAISYARSFLDL